MPALDLVRPSVTVIRVTTSVSTKFACELKLPPHIRSLGLISADSDDVTYIAAGEATKQAVVEVVCGCSLYADVAHGPSSTAGEVLIVLGGPNPVEVHAGLDVMVADTENDTAFQRANDAENTVFLVHVASHAGSHLSLTAGTTPGGPMAYLVVPPPEATYGIDAALRFADVQLVTYVPPLSETDYSVAFLTGSQAACKATCNAFTDAVLEIAHDPTRRAQRRLPMINALGLLKVDGMIAAVDAAGVVLKAASVRLLSHEVFDSGRLTLMVGDDLTACRVALDAGCVAAMCTGRIISRKGIGRPGDDTQWLLIGFSRQPEQSVKEPDAPVIVAESADELLVLLTSVRQGMMTEEVAIHFGRPLEKTRNALEQFFSTETLRKRSSRYRLKSH